MVEVTYKKRRPTRQVLTLPAKREWKSAKSSLTTADWLRTGTTIDYDLRHGLETLRARARVEAQNNDHVRHFLRLVRTNVVGPHGVRLQGRVRRRINGEQDARANSAIEEAWTKWGKRGSADVTGTRSWKGIQREAIETVARDGEALWRRVTWDNGFGFTLQMMDPARLDVSYNKDLKDGRVIVMGVELDPWRRPVGYHFLEDDRDVNRGAYVVSTSERFRVPADEMYHMYMPEFAYQTRGAPWLATAMLRLHMLRGYEDAEVTASRIGAAKMGFYEREVGAGKYVGDAADAAGNPIQDARPGEFEILPEGWNFSGWNPDHPNAAYSDFVRACLRSIASGLGVNYNTLANDLEGVNYTSLRHGMLTERDVWMLVQDWFVESFCERIYNDWLFYALASNAITDAGGKPLPRGRIDDFRRVVWQPRRWAWVDPLKESQARGMDYGLRTRSVSDMIREDGRDPEEVFAEIASEKETMEALGIAPMVGQQEQPTGEPDELDGNDEAGP